MEEAVGHPLLLRTSRNVRLTAAGEELLKRAQQTLRKVAEDVHNTRRIGRGEVGTLTVGFIASAMLTVLLAYELARSMFTRSTGLLAGVIVATTPMLCGAARFANPDFAK